MASMHSLKRLEGKVCIITGSSSGVGRSIALGYAREGAKVACVDLHQSARREVKEEADVDTDELIRSQGGQAMFVQTDVSSAKAVQAMVEKVRAEFGRIEV